MSVIGSNILAGASGQGGGYNLTKSLRFRSSASAYLNRTGGTSTNRKIHTFSFWTKYSVTGGTRVIASAGSDDNNREWVGFDSNNFYYQVKDSGNFYELGTSQVLRDPSAWYHLMVAVDTTQATDSNRVKVYVNGVQVTAFGTATYPPINDDLFFNDSNGGVSYICALRGFIGSFHYDGYLAEFNFIDGQQLTPSSFGETSTTTGVWIPKKYTGSYGTNGFYLPFTDTTSTSTLGTDFSGNSNTWTVNGISLTAGSTYDSMNDVPTLTSATTANYAVINPLQNGGLTITNGNLTWAGAGSSAKCATGSIAMPSGKWYFEALITGSSGGNWYAGVCNLSPTLTSTPLSTSTGWGLATGGGGSVLYKVNNNTFTSLSSSSVTGSVVSFAIDVDAGKIWFAQNGTWLEGSPSAGTGASYTNLTGTQIPFVAGYDSNDQGSINFGQRPFAYTPPTGFVELNTFNISAGTITTSGSFTGNAATDGPFIYLNGVPTAMTINGNSVTFGTDADKLSNGFKVRSSSSSYNASGSNTYSISTTSDKFKFANAQPNP